MGTWNTGIFSDDVACDVRDDYVDRLRFGSTGKQATTEMIREWADDIADSDDGPVFWLALAATQRKYGRLEARVKTKALAVIKKGLDLERWESASDPRLLRSREKVLAVLKKQLESPQPPEKKVRVIKMPEPLAKVERFWEQDQVVGYRTESGNWYLFITQREEEHEYGGHLPYFELLEWSGAKLPPADKIEKIRTTGHIFTVGYYRTKRPPLERIERLPIYRAPIRRGFMPYYCADWRTIDETLRMWIEECDWFPKRGFRRTRKN